MKTSFGTLDSMLLSSLENYRKPQIHQTCKSFHIHKNDFLQKVCAGEFSQITSPFTAVALRIHVQKSKPTYCEVIGNWTRKRFRYLVVFASHCVGSDRLRSGIWWNLQDVSSYRRHRKP